MIEPTWAERYWTPKEREKLAQLLSEFDARQLREILTRVLLDCDEPQLVAPYLFGCISGMAERVVMVPREIIDTPLRSYRNGN